MNVKNLLAVVFISIVLEACAGSSSDGINGEITPPPENLDPLFTTSTENFDSFGGIEGNTFQPDGERTGSFETRVNPPDVETSLVDVSYDTASDTLSIRYGNQNLPAESNERATITLKPEFINNEESTSTVRVYTRDDDVNPLTDTDFLIVDKALVVQTGGPEFGFRHLSFGAWVADPFPSDAQFTEARGEFLFGQTTDPESLPPTGTATYFGIVLGTGEGPDTDIRADKLFFTLQGDMGAEVDFTLTQLSLQLENIMATRLGSGDQFQLSNLIGGADFNGANTAFSGNLLLPASEIIAGEFTGTFFGPADPFPAEIGGTGFATLFQELDGVADTRLEIDFAFGGTKN